MKSDSQEILKRTEQYFQEFQLANYKKIDKFFAFLMPLQWLGGIIAVLLISPLSWDGTESKIHIHVWASIFLGGAISLFPTFLALVRPGQFLTRQVITVGQMLTSALLIHLSGGRIETHFHIFGSLALLAFYRDEKVFPTAALVTTLDHFIRGFLFPYSVFGVTNASPWRAVEHAAWVVFEVAFLWWSCRASNADVRQVARLRALENQQQQDQKLESIGQLAAGIAHEINTPIQFVGDNVRFIQQEFSEIKNLLGMCVELPARPSVVGEMNELAKALDADYLCDEIPKALEQSLDGISRITKIVSAMKEFSHPGQGEKQAVDLNRAIESTIIVSTNEWKYVSELKTEFDSSLPLVPCFVGELNQVILNLIVNSAHAIEEVIDRQPGRRGLIEVSTKNLGDRAEIRIRDSGAGIPAGIAEKIYDPFFTTKGVGKGTGQGLAIARNIIINKHGGTIQFQTKMGEGTEFIIRLPLQEGATQIEAISSQRQLENVEHV